MWISRNFGLLWYVLPFFKSNLIKNKVGLALSILIGSKEYKLKINKTFVITFPATEFNNLLAMIGILSFSFSYKIIENDKIELTLDSNNKIVIPTKNLSYEDHNLLELLFLGVKSGADFIFSEENEKTILRDKSIKIFEQNGKKIVEVFNGTKFYLESIHPGNSIIETFIQKVHMVKSVDDFTDKIVLDIGAECGDTALYYASLNATVYSFEPIKQNFEDLKKNLELNPNLSKKIIPVNIAVGEDKMLEFYQDPITPNIGSSFVYNRRGKNAIISKVQGHSLETILKKYDIKHVDLLKADCKNCEFFFNEESLKNVDMVKIETITNNNANKCMDDLLKVLKKSGFSYVLHKITPYDYSSNRVSAHIFGKK